MFWATLHDNILIGPFRVPDGVNMNSGKYVDFLQQNFLPYYHQLAAKTTKQTIFMLDNAPSDASRHTRHFFNNMASSIFVFKYDKKVLVCVQSDVVCQWKTV